MTYKLLPNTSTTYIPVNNIFYNNHTRLLGHRGARGEIFENSKQGFEYVANLSKKSNDTLVGIEFDIQLTKDGTIIVFHDDSLLRLYGKQSRIDQLTDSEICKLSKHTRFKHTEHRVSISRLIDILPLLINYEHVELEVKTNERTNYANLTNALADTLQSFEDSQNRLQTVVTLTSFDITLHHLLKTHPFLSTFKRGLLVEPYNQTLSDYRSLNHKFLDSKDTTVQSKKQNNDFDTNALSATHLYDIPDIAQRLLCTRIGLFYPMYDKKLIALCQQFDIKTSAWTVNKLSDAEQLILLGVDHIISDYPSMMLGIK